MGALVDISRIAVARVPDTESNERPREAVIGVLGQAEDKPEWRPGRARLAKRNVELATGGEPDSVRSFCFASLPCEPNPASFDFPAGALRLNPGRGMRVKALDLLPPLDRRELDRYRRQRAAPGIASPRRQRESPR